MASSLYANAQAGRVPRAQGIKSNIERAPKPKGKWERRVRDTPIPQKELDFFLEAKRKRAAEISRASKKR